MRIAHTLSLVTLALALAACGGSSSSGSFASGNGDNSSGDMNGGDGNGNGSGSGGSGGGGSNGGGSSGGGTGGDPTDAKARVANLARPGFMPAMLEPNTASCGSNVRLEGGRHYQVTLPSDSGQTISFEVIEPKTINCTVGNPLVLHGHGFGGARTQDPSGTFLERLQDNGYAVISIDQRGFNDSSGTVRVMDPDFEGQDLLKILDWAEDNLDYLAYSRPNVSSAYNLVSGATGGSYGGMYQLLIHNIDTKNRLDVLTPDITPHDLRSSLYPGNVVKSAWVSLLVVGGEAGANQPLLAGLDPVIKETLVRGVVNNEIPTPALNFFYYHSVRYFAAPDETDISDMDFLTSLLTMSSAMPRYVGDVRQVPKKIDILFSQGMRDTLFNFNEAWANYQAYKALGGDVRLMTHESGHILPGTSTIIDNLGPLNMLTNPLLGGLMSAGLSLPDLQKPSGRNNCGALSRDDAGLAFLNTKLLPPSAQDTPDDVASALASLKDKVCLSLNNGNATTAGDTLLLSPSQVMASDNDPITIPPTMIPVPNSVLGVISLLQPTFIPLEGMMGPMTVAGIGQLDITLNNIAEPLNGCALPLSVPEQLTSALPAPLSSLLGVLPTRLPISACDAIVLVGFGARSGMAAPRLLDEQLQPIRGLGEHQVAMVGVGERLAAGEQLGLLVYGYNLQYLTSLSRDLLVPAVTIAGTVSVPKQP